MSGFNEEGYAFGIKLINNEDYNNEISENYTKYDYRYNFIRKIGVYNKIDKNGKEEEITRNEYYKNSKIKQNKKDENIMIKKNVDRKIDIEYIFVESIFPLIIALFSIIIIIKIIKKEEKN